MKNEKTELVLSIDELRRIHDIVAEYSRDCFSIIREETEHCSNVDLEIYTELKGRQVKMTFPISTVWNDQFYKNGELNAHVG